MKYLTTQVSSFIKNSFNSSSSYGIEGFGDVANDDRDPRRDRVEMSGGIQAQKGHHHSNGAGGEGEEA